MFDDMISNAELFYQQLGIPYRVVNIVSGTHKTFYLIEILIYMYKM